jgi:hypothetical protein
LFSLKFLAFKFELGTDKLLKDFQSNADQNHARQRLRLQVKHGLAAKEIVRLRGCIGFVWGRSRIHATLNIRNDLASSTNIRGVSVTERILARDRSGASCLGVRHRADKARVYVRQEAANSFYNRDFIHGRVGTAPPMAWIPTRRRWDQRSKQAFCDDVDHDAWCGMR